MSTYPARLTIEEAVEILKIDRSTLYKRVRDRLIKITKDGGRSFITGSEIERYLEGDIRLPPAPLLAPPMRDPQSAARKTPEPPDIEPAPASGSWTIGAVSKISGSPARTIKQWITFKHLKLDHPLTKRGWNRFTRRDLLHTVGLAAGSRCGFGPKSADTDAIIRDLLDLESGSGRGELIFTRLGVTITVDTRRLHARTKR